METINIQELSLEVYPVDNQETSKGCFDDMNLSDRQIWIAGAEKIMKIVKDGSLETQARGRMNRNSQSTQVTEVIDAVIPNKQLIIVNPDSDNIIVQDVVVMGMPLTRWTYKGCEADFGVGEDFATLFVIESKEKRKGYATLVLSVAKSFYEAKGKKFGGTVALNDVMRHIYRKLKIEEYGN